MGNLPRQIIEGRSARLSICTLIIDIMVKNNHFTHNLNNFQEILSKNKEMTFTEMNKGSKSTFAYE